MLYKEIWKDVGGYEGYYQISNSGNVKSTKRDEEGVYHSDSDKIYSILCQEIIKFNRQLKGVFLSMLCRVLVYCFKYSIAGPAICFYAVFAGWKEGELLCYLKALWKSERFSFDNVKKKSMQEECPMHGGNIDDCDEPCCEYTTCSKFVN